MRGSGRVYPIGRVQLRQSQIIAESLSGGLKSFFYSTSSCGSCFSFSFIANVSSACACPSLRTHVRACKLRSVTEADLRRGVAMTITQLKNGIHLRVEIRRIALWFIHRSMMALRDLSRIWSRGRWNIISRAIKRRRGGKGIPIHRCNWM